MTKQVQRLLWIGLAGLFVCFVLLGTFINPPDDSLSSIKKSGLIRVGYAIEAPYSFVDSLGNVTGESPSEAEAIIKKMGNYKIEWRLSEFNSLIPDLVAGKIDVIAAGMFINKSRSTLVNFSSPTFHVLPGLLVKEGNPLHLHSFEDAMNAGDTVKLAVIEGAMEDRLLIRIGFPQVKIVKYPDAESARLSVESGITQGLALSLPTLRWMVKMNPGSRLVIADPFKVPDVYLSRMQGYGAFVFSKQDRELLKEWNKHQSEFTGSKQQLEIFGRYGFPESALPGKVTIDNIIK